MAFWGLLLVGSAAAFMINAYLSNGKKRALEYQELFEFFKLIRDKLSPDDSPLWQLASEAEATAPAVIELLEIVKESRAGSQHGWRDRLSLPRLAIDAKDAKKAIDYLHDFGSPVHDREIERAEEIKKLFETAARGALAESEKNSKVAWAIFTAAFASAAIMIF